MVAPLPRLRDATITTNSTIDSAKQDRPVLRGTRPTSVARSLLPWLVVFVVPATVHLVFGVDDLGLVEEWGLHLRFDEVGPVLWTPSDAALASQAIRPFTVIPHAIGHLLHAETFAGYHLMHAASLGLKGLAMMSLLRRLRLSSATSLVGGLTFALFPAWDGLFIFRGLHIQIAVALFVVAVERLIAFQRRPSPIVGASVILALGTSLMLYEVAYVACLFAPLLVLTSIRPSLRSWALTLSVWFAAPFINGLRILALIRSGHPLYQVTIVTEDQREPWREVTSMARMVIDSGLRSFIDPPRGFTIGVTAVLLIAVASIALVLVDPKRPRSHRDHPVAPSSRALVALAAGAIVLAPVVALVYWTTESLLADPFRVFSIASVPLTIAFAAVFELAVRYTPRPAYLALGALVVASVISGGIAQRGAWHAYSIFQEDFFGAILSAVPEGTATSTFIIIDPEYVAGREVYTVIPEILDQAIDVMLPGSQDSIHCYQPIEAMPPDDGVMQLGAGECVRGDDTIRSYMHTVPIGDSTVIEIRHTADTPGWTGDPVDLPWPRAKAMLGCAADGSCDGGVQGIQARVLQSPDDPALRSDP